MNNIIYLSSIFPLENRQFFIDNSKGAISNANDSLQGAILQGFKSNNCEVSILNVPNIGAFPKRFKKLNSIAFKFTEESYFKGYNIGFCNLQLIKHIFIENNIRNYILSNVELIKKSNLIFIYDLYPPFLNVVQLLKNVNNNCKIIVMVPDIIGFTSDKTGFIHKNLKHRAIRSLMKASEAIDGFIYLTEKMREILPGKIRNKPFLVIEGILNSNNILYNKKDIENKYIFYSGSLDVRHGILNLVEAYINANIDDSIELHICGDGDGKKSFLDKIENNASIKYCGQISRDEVIKKQAEAFLLINPRNSSGEFTKYSFPSKVIEYFLSGTPTFMYKLEGIPREYFEHCFTLEDESIKSLTKFLEKLPLMDRQKLRERGASARAFVLEQKNPLNQVNKIINFYNSLIV